MIRKHFLLGASLLSVGAVMAATPAIPKDPAIEAKVEELLSRMTLEEKIGQMTQVVVDVIGGFDAQGDFKLNEAMMDSVFGKYKIGSILNAPGTCAPTLAKWNEIIPAIQKKSMETIGIPCVYFLDQNHGTTYTQGGTLFPQNINVAATFNSQIAYDAAKTTAYETRAGDCPWVCSPTLDLGRDQRWPRLWENYGEDPLVNAVMGAAAVKGFQGDDPNHLGKNSVGVSVKHYMGYGVPFSGKDRTPVIISESDLREKHFAPYKAAAQAGALSFMCNSGSVNGVPGHINYRLLTQWLKDELGWDGVIVSDWADIVQLFRREKVAENKKEAIKMAINAGIDMSMDPYSWDFCILLKELVDEGEVPMSRIDDAARRILRMKYRLGLFGTPDTRMKDYPLFGGKEHAQLALKSAEESMVLLKNTDGILPLPQGKKILVTGPNANSMRCLVGGWSYTWQGHLANQFTEQYNTILEAIQGKFGKGNIVYEPGLTYKEDGKYWEENAPEIEKAVAAAKDVDYIVACIGENSYCETPGNLSDLNLSANQKELVKALAKTGKPVVLVLNEGRPRIISDIEPLAAAVVDIILPGNYGGDALANLLAGTSNFSGKLPFTYPKEVNSLSTYDYKISEVSETMEGAYDYNAVISAQWPFGYGLSYTSFVYGNLTVDKPEFKNGDMLTFSIDVTNSGSREGKEAVLLYSSDLVASSIVPDNRRLRAFEKISLNPGETKTVRFTIPATDLAYVRADGKWMLEKGQFRCRVADKVVELKCTETTVFDTPNID